MSDRWAVDIVKSVRNKETKENQSRNQLIMGSITSIAPLSLSLFGQSVKKNIYINPSLMVDAEGEKIEQAFNNNPADGQWFEFLKRYHEATAIKTGDTVIVMQSGVTFYIMSKVVSV